MGFGCQGELPGMGGVDGGKNFKLNCADWERLRERLSQKERDEISRVQTTAASVMCAPVTGAVQNIGFAREEDFYIHYFSAAHAAGIGVCAGDGFPDEKLKLGIAAARAIREKDESFRAVFFIKPYSNSKMTERAEWAAGAASAIGCDIDAYAIATMRGQAALEKKSARDLRDFRRALGVPFALKGVFTEESVELCKEVLPDICVVSNHGGRVETDEGSSAEFLAARAAELKNFCGELWVDGGIRCRADTQTALHFGASKVLAARPFISALCKDGESGMESAARKMYEALP